MYIHIYMEKSKQEDQNRFSKGRSSSWPSNKSVWDCGSTLYDSYELHSFKRQIDSAIASSPRTLSMPHLTDHRRRFHQPPPPSSSSSSSSSSSNNKSFKISRTFQKLLRFVSKSSSSNNKFRICGSDGHNKLEMADLEEKYSKERLYVVYDRYDQAVLSTIPELPEFEMGGLSPEISSLVRKSASERFTTPAPIRISCA